ncbi:MAG: hypothetical protein K2J95_03100 [Lachnospiraceae bacterium]|nr:hypothetical protein [Lachnospiraceae bacterium]
MKEKNKTLWPLGIFNVFYVFSVFILICIVWLGLMGLMELNILTGVFGYAILLTTLNAVLYLPPLSCIWGIVQGVRCWKSACGVKRVDGLVCFILSMIGFLLFAVVMAFLMNVSV